MKVILLFCLLIGSKHIFAATCDIEKGFYTISVQDQLEVNIKGCGNIGWGQEMFYGTASFEETDLMRAKRELLTKHRPMIVDRCLLHGTGDIEINVQTSNCYKFEPRALANFSVKYKCHLF